MTLTLKNVLEISPEIYNDITVELSRIDPTRLDREICDHTAHYAHYHGLLYYCKRNLDVAKLSLDVWMAQEDREVRASSEGKKLTAVQMEALIKCNPRYLELNEEVIRLEEVYNLVKGICLTLEHKKDMLVQLSANTRAETKING